MKQYKGVRRREGVVVTVDGQPLNAPLDLWNHSPTGFEWGYAGSGPAQLALALLADALGNPEEASRYHQEFKRLIVAKLEADHWTLTQEQIRQCVASIRST